MLLKMTDQENISEPQTQYSTGEARKYTCRQALQNLPATLLTGAMCCVGLTETSSEMGDQDMWFVYSLLAILVCAVFTWVFNVRKVRVSIVDIVAGAMFAWYVACYYVNDSIAVSRLLEAGLFAAMYVSLRVLLSVHRNLGRWLFVVLCVCGIVEATIGIQQAVGARYSNHNLFNVTGTFFNPGPYGGYLAVIVSMTLGWIVSRYEYADNVFRRFKNIGDVRFRRILWVLVFCVAVCTVIAIAVILPATVSRAAIVAVGIAFVAIVFGDGRIRRRFYDLVHRHKKMAAVITIVSVVVICGGLYGIYALKKDSADGRLLMWKMDAKVMMENSVTGVGPGYYRGAYGDVQSEYFSTAERSETEIAVAGSPEYGFNEYLQIGAETGVIGLVLFVCLVVAALWRLLRRGSPYAFGFIALMVFAFFSYPFSLLPLKMLFVVLLAVAGSCYSRQRKATVIHRVIVGAVFAGCVGVVALATKPYVERIEATREWRKMSRWYSMEIYSAVVEDYPELLPLMGENPIFLFEYGRSLNQEGRYQESLEIMTRATRLSNDPMNYNVIGNNYKALGEYEKAAEAYLKAHHIVPNRMYPLYLLGQMYSEIGDRERAAHYARRVVEMAPKVPSPATNDMQREMKDLLESIEKQSKVLCY